MSVIITKYSKNDIINMSGVMKVMNEEENNIESLEEFTDKIKENINKLIVYHITKQGSELVSKNAVIRLINRYSKYGDK